MRILEIDGERRRLSLSLKRVEEGEQPVPRADGAESVHTMPDLKLSEEAFPATSAVAVEEAELVEEPVAELELETADAFVEPSELAEAPSEAPSEEPAPEVGSEQSDSG